MQASGVRLERNKTDVIAAGETLRPLRDQIIVKPLNWQPSKILAVVSHAKPLRGIVTAVGPGCYPWRYNADRSKRWASKAFRPTQVKVGDTVELGGLEIGGYSFPQVVIGGETHIICREEDVTGICE